jgi:hypothetical protein
MQSFTTYTNWNDYFKQKFTASRTFYLTGHRKEGKTEVEIYTSSIIGLKTTIEIGYASPLRLLFLRIFNPFTPGLNSQQRRQLFSRNDFYPHLDQDEEGLEFNNFNIRGIDEYLSKGFQGSETVYVRNGRPAKSILKSNTLPLSQNTLTFYFEKSAEENYDQTIEIDLNTIYMGSK